MTVLQLMTLLIAAQANPSEGPAIICTRLAQVKVALGERIRIERSQDGVAYSVSGKTEHFWGVREISKRGLEAFKTGPLLFEQNGVRVHRLTQGGRFRGYVAADRHGRFNHFHGSYWVLRGTALDRHFFRKVDFGPTRPASCGKG